MFQSLTKFSITGWKNVKINTLKINHLLDKNIWLLKWTTSSQLIIIKKSSKIFLVR